MADAGKFTTLLQRLEAVTNRLEAMESKPTAVISADGDLVSPMIREYDQLIADQVASYVALSAKLGAPDVEAQAKLVQKAFEAQREMLVTVSKCRKPSAADQSELCKATGDLIAQVQAMVDRRSTFSNHLQVCMTDEIHLVASIC